MKYTTTWNRETIKAWKASVAHWERLASGNRIDDEGILSGDCALCDLFLEKNCKGCPVAAATGKSGCDGSPWISIEEEFDRADEFGNGYDGYESPGFLKAAKKELAFLKSLRTEKAKK